MVCTLWQTSNKEGGLKMKPNVSLKAPAIVVRCRYCSMEGEEGKDIIWIDHLDRLGHSTLIPFCKDIEVCLDRGRG